MSWSWKSPSARADVYHYDSCHSFQVSSPIRKRSLAVARDPSWITNGNILDDALRCKVKTVVSSTKPCWSRYVRISCRRLSVRYTLLHGAGGLSLKTNQTRGRRGGIGKYGRQVRNAGWYFGSRSCHARCTPKPCSLPLTGCTISASTLSWGRIVEINVSGEHASSSFNSSVHCSWCAPRRENESNGFLQ